MMFMINHSSVVKLVTAEMNAKIMIIVMVMFVIVMIMMVTAVKLILQ